MRIAQMRPPPIKNSHSWPMTKGMLVGVLALMLLSATGGGLFVDAMSWKTEAPAAIGVLSDPSAPEKEAREAILTLQFNVENAVDALQRAAHRADSNAERARTSLAWIRERAK